MLKRLFLAGTITFPLYLIVLLESPPQTSALAKPQFVHKASEVVSELKQDYHNVKQELRKFKSFSTEANTFLY